LAIAAPRLRYELFEQLLEYKMADENFAQIRAHRQNIQRYRQLLETSLTELERDFIVRRLGEEQSAIEALAATMLPVMLNGRAPSRDPRLD
jgi:hypothetical protein